MTRGAIMKAKIKENIPYCSKCNLPLTGRIKDYNVVVTKDNKRYVQFKRYCACGAINTYEALITLDYTERYTLSDTVALKVD